MLRGELLDIPHQTIPQLFQRLLREDGQHFTHCPAIISQGLTMTYSDVDILSNSWSACLRTVLRRLQRQHRERKISEDLANASEDHLTRVVVVPNQEFTHKRIGQPVIGIFIPPNANRIVAMMSVFKVGACYVPLDSTLPDQRIADILEETKCQVRGRHHVLFFTFSVQIFEASIKPLWNLVWLDFLTRGESVELFLTFFRSCCTRRRRVTAFCTR